MPGTGHETSMYTGPDLLRPGKLSVTLQPYLFVVKRNVLSLCPFVIGVYKG